ncbi:MAG: triose-phosphate isomerase family protein, partial [Gammaproteobacteria bacterium]
MKKYLIANWKMNGSFSTNQKLLEDLANKLEFLESGDLISNVSLVICPSFLHLCQVGDFIKARGLSWHLGAQNLAFKAQGALTGEISASMLQDLGLSHVIIGHSERRQIFKEDSNTINLKLQLAFSHELIPVLCVAELSELEASLSVLQHYAKSPCLIAYEPLWAIGTGKTPELKDLEDFHGQVQVFLKQKGLDFPILYGGSLN